MPDRSPADIIEQETRAKYSGNTYLKDTICCIASPNAHDYFSQLLWTKMELVRRYATESQVLDLCCATGDHLLSLSYEAVAGIGLDFSRPFLVKAETARRAGNIRNVSFVEANARAIPLRDNSVDLVYSFSSLYHIPHVAEVIAEVARVLRVGGKCVLEMGNLFSLNTIVCRSYPELAHPCHIPVKKMRKLLRAADLVIIEHRAFQILPLWGDRPRWMRPLLKPEWKRLLQRKLGGKMVDEWISNAPGLKYLAFRHLFVCEKVAQH